MAIMNKNIFDIKPISMSDCEEGDTITFITSNGHYTEGVIKNKFFDDKYQIILDVTSFSGFKYTLNDFFTRIDKLTKANKISDSSKFYYLLCR